MKLNFKSTCLLMLCIFIFLGVSCVCASDADNVTKSVDVSSGAVNAAPVADCLNQLNSDIDDVSQNQSVQYSPNKNVEYQKPLNSKVCTVDKLNSDIKNLTPGDTYNLEGDCHYWQDSTRVLIIGQDNVTINGNGHTIDAGDSFIYLKVTGNNVKLINLTLTNFKSIYTPTTSPVCWYGDNGYVSGCTFYNNVATHGGAISWMGDNGTVNNSLFVNNIAWGLGGGLYVNGTNNLISNSTFINCSSEGENIFYGRGAKNCTINNVLSDSKIYNVSTVYSSNFASEWVPFSLRIPVQNIFDEYGCCLIYINYSGEKIPFGADSSVLKSFGHNLFPEYGNYYYFCPYTDNIGN